MSITRKPEPVESAAYAIGRRLARGDPVRQVRIVRREVHLPDGRVAVEERIEIEEPL